MHISIKIQSPFASKVFNIQFVLQTRNEIKQILYLKFINSEIFHLYFSSRSPNMHFILMQFFFFKLNIDWHRHDHSF